jgi:hypothetical protein
VTQSFVVPTITRRSLRSPLPWVKAGATSTLREALPLIALFLAVVVPAGSIAVAGHFDGLYGQDPYAYLDYATGPLADSLRHLRPPPPFYWPPGYPLLLALATLVIGSGALAGQVVSLVAGGLVAVFTALLGAEVWRANQTPGSDATTSREVTAVTFLAGLLTGLAGQLWQSSVVVMADTTGLAMASAGAWALVRYSRQKQARWLILAAAALSWAVVTRWAYALVAIPCAMYAAVALARQDRRKTILHVIGASILVGLVLAPVLIPVLLGLLAGGSSTAPFAADLQVYTWSPVNAGRREFVTADGVLRYALPNGLYYALAPARPFLLTPLLAWLILPGLWSVARRPRAASLLIVGWAGIIFAFHAGAPWQNFRFTLALLPPLAILAAIGAVAIDRRVRHLVPRLGRAVLPIIVAIGACWMVVSGTSLVRGFVERKDADLSTVQWLRAQLPPDAILLTFGFTLTARHYTDLETVDLSETDPVSISQLAAENRPIYVLLDVTNVETQWPGQLPSTNYHWLRDGAGLDSVGQSQTYTLFRARRPAAATERRSSSGAT